MLRYVRRRTTCSAALRWARWRMVNSGLSELLLAVSADGLKPQHYDLWNLYRNVHRRRPKVVIEFGVGCSTIVLAEAMSRNGVGHLITVDASRRWLDAMRDVLPNHLRSRVTLHHSPLAMMEYKGEPCHRYVDVPDDVPDLLYLDGPDAADVPGWDQSKPQIAADPLIMEPCYKPGFRLIIDTRLANTAFLRRHFERKYRFRYHDVFGVVTFDLIN